MASLAVESVPTSKEKEILQPDVGGPVPLSSHQKQLQVDAAPKKHSERKWKVDKISLPRVVDDFLVNEFGPSPLRQIGNKPVRFSSALLNVLSTMSFPRGHTFSVVVDSERRLLRVHSASVECTVGAILGAIKRNSVGQKGTSNPHPFALCEHYEPILQRYLAGHTADKAPNPLKYVDPSDECSIDSMATTSILCPLGVHCTGIHITLRKKGKGPVTLTKDQNPSVYYELLPGQIRQNFIHRRTDDSEMLTEEGYECFPAGTTVSLAEPNSREPMLVVDSGRMLQTHGAMLFIMANSFDVTSISCSSASCNPEEISNAENTGSEAGHCCVPNQEDQHDLVQENECSDSESDEGSTGSTDGEQHPTLECRGEPQKTITGGSQHTQLQHCAHFKKHGICFLGPTCKFVHLIAPASAPSSVHSTPKVVDSAPSQAPALALPPTAPTSAPTKKAAAFKGSAPVSALPPPFHPKQHPKGPAVPPGYYEAGPSGKHLGGGAPQQLHPQACMPQPLAGRGNPPGLTPGLVPQTATSPAGDIQPQSIVLVDSSTGIPSSGLPQQQQPNPNPSGSVLPAPSSGPTFVPAAGLGKQPTTQGNTAPAPQLVMVQAPQPPSGSQWAPAEPPQKILPTSQTLPSHLPPPPQPFVQQPQFTPAQPQVLATQASGVGAQPQPQAQAQAQAQTPATMTMMNLQQQQLQALQAQLAATQALLGQLQQQQQQQGVGNVGATQQQMQLQQQVGNVLPNTQPQQQLQPQPQSQQSQQQQQTEIQLVGFNPAPGAPVTLLPPGRNSPGTTAEKQPMWPR